jgi:L-ribulose-5-phosphate 3-epimerase
MTRRELLAAGPAAAGAAQAIASGPRFVKSICSVIFPPQTPLAESFERAKNAGFDGIELRMGDQISLDTTHDQMKRVADDAHKAGIAIASMWVSKPLADNPINSPDPAVRARGVAAIEKSVELAQLAGCGALLIYPARLGAGAKFQIGSQDTWDRVTAAFRQAIPAAERAKVILTPENVWNKFLLSPLEMRAFVDQFHNPWLQTHFDIGNVMQYGYPQDWILTLGSRIKRIHVKDYKLSARSEQGRFVGLLEGDVDWKAVMAALVKVDYHGFLSPEIGYDAGEPDQLKKVSRALDTILAMA